jgi:hypothetical protein
MDIVAILEKDYQKFPLDQNYNIYGENVYFQDPLNKFKGIKKYQKMIKFLNKIFQKITMDLHKIEQKENIIKTEWTLSMNFTLLPWKPRLIISGNSELTLNQNNLIISHIDYWNCSRFDVFKQVFNQKH